jgi:CHAT domain-containing protein/tetratricopeptide (TPR) repeat protein
MRFLWTGNSSVSQQVTRTILHIRVRVRMKSWRGKSGRMYTTSVLALFWETSPLVFHLTILVKGLRGPWRLGAIMTVSCMIAYRWDCARCGRAQEAGVWRIVYAPEHEDVVERGGPGLVDIACAACGHRAEIDEPVLVIRPGDPLPLLLGLPRSRIDNVEEPSRELGEEAAASLGDISGIPGPMIPLPRTLIAVALARNPSDDAEDAEKAASAAFGADPQNADLYRVFLQRVRDVELRRKAAATLQELWSVPLDELAAFLTNHPELGSQFALAGARWELAQHPDDGREVFEARLALVEGLASSAAPDRVAREYIAALERFGARLNAAFSALLEEVNANPGPAGIPYLRSARQMAAELSHESLEADLGADLARRLLNQPTTSHENLEEAISLLEHSLSLVDENDGRWADVASNLAAAYWRRPTGDATQKWEAARELMERASNVADRVRDPRRWAVIQTNYGFLLSERPDGSAEDLDRAIAHVQAGLEERTPERDVRDWAYSLVNLGFLYSRRGTAGDLASALTCYEQALARLRPADDALLWATLQNNYADLQLRAEHPDPRAARDAVRAGLDVMDAIGDTLVGGRLRWALAGVEERMNGPESADALRLRQEALQMLTPRLAPDLHIRIAGELFVTYARMGDFSKMADVATGQLLAFSYLYDSQLTAAGQHRVLAGSPRLARWAAYALARAGHTTAAVEVIEQGRARQLSVALSRDTVELARLADMDEHLAARYRDCLAVYRAALEADNVPVPPGDLERRIAVAEQDMQQVLSEIRAIAGFERFLRPATIADITADAEGLPVIYLVSAPWGSYVLTVRSGPEGPGVDAVHVPEVTSTSVVGLAARVAPDGELGLLAAQATGQPDLLAAALDRLGELTPLVQPVADMLSRERERIAVVVPTGMLGLIPLAAVPVNSTAGEFLDDVGEIRFAPSASIYAGCRKRAAIHGQQRLVGIADPAGTPPLPWSRVELAAIQDMFQPESSRSCAFGSDATRSWLLEHLHDASHVHLACHGYSDITFTTGGYLLLAGGSQLSINDLIDGRLAGCRMAVASACQSGHYSTTDIPDEFTGLPAGFLQAGAACAITSLWPVYDHTTALLMIRLYELMGLDTDRAGSHPVSALRQARKWLRQLTPQEAERFVQSHPRLIKPMEGEITAIRSATEDNQGQHPYSSAVHWASFVAWGY